MLRPSSPFELNLTSRGKHVMSLYRVARGPIWVASLVARRRGPSQSWTSPRRRVIAALAVMGSLVAGVSVVIPAQVAHADLSTAWSLNPPFLRGQGGTGCPNGECFGY